MADGYCQKCKSKLFPGDEDAVEGAGVCSSCVTYDKTEGKVYQNMYIDWMKEQRKKVPVPTHCPRCVDVKQELLPASKKVPFPHCERCGGHWDGKKMVYICQTCGKRVEKLSGLFIPWQCEPCHVALCEKNIKSGNVCRMCHLPRNICTC